MYKYYTVVRSLHSLLAPDATNLDPSKRGTLQSRTIVWRVIRRERNDSAIESGWLSQLLRWSRTGEDKTQFDSVLVAHAAHHGTGTKNVYEVLVDQKLLQTPQ